MSLNTSGPPGAALAPLLPPAVFCPNVTWVPYFSRTTLAWANIIEAPTRPSTVYLSSLLGPLQIQVRTEEACLPGIHTEATQPPQTCPKNASIPIYRIPVRTAEGVSVAKLPSNCLARPLPFQLTPFQFLPRTPTPPAAHLNFSIRR